MLDEVEESGGLGVMSIALEDEEALSGLHPSQIEDGPSVLRERFSELVVVHDTEEEG